MFCLSASKIHFKGQMFADSNRRGSIVCWTFLVLTLIYTLNVLPVHRTLVLKLLDIHSVSNTYSKTHKQAERFKLGAVGAAAAAAAAVFVPVRELFGLIAIWSEGGVVCFSSSRWTSQVSQPLMKEGREEVWSYHQGLCWSPASPPSSKVRPGSVINTRSTHVPARTLLIYYSVL